MLDAAIVHFECHLGEIKNAPKIRDILIEKKQEEYDLNTELWGFSALPAERPLPQGEARDQ